MGRSTKEKTNEVVWEVRGKAASSTTLILIFSSPTGWFHRALQPEQNAARSASSNQRMAAEATAEGTGKRGKVRLLVFCCRLNWDNAVTDMPGKPSARRVLIRHPESCVALTIFFLLSFSRFCSSCSAVRLYSCRPTNHVAS